jgi:glycosyltransferase involved in cell wall biosynthesis
LARRLATAPRRPWPDRPVPVALVITELDVGGAEKALVSLATGLDRRRWAPNVIALGPEAPLAAPIRAAGVAVECLGVNPSQPLGAVARLASALRRQGPDLVQSFLFHANVAARLAAPWAGGPWVIGGLRVAERRKRWHLAVDRLTAPLASGAVCVSEGVRRFSREAGGWRDDRLTVIPNAVDVAPFDSAVAVPRESLGVPPGAFLTLYVGRLNVQKALPVLLDAAELVIASRPDWHLALAGDGPEHDWLRSRLATSPALAAKVHPLGPRGDVPGLLKTADLLVLPSLWEGMPNVVLEAMAARRAVVATAVEGTEDLVIPGETGWLIPPGDAPALSAALLAAASDPERLRRMGEAARGRVEVFHSPEQTVRAYERLWGEILGYDIRSQPGSC